MQATHPKAHGSRHRALFIVAVLTATLGAGVYRAAVHAAATPDAPAAPGAQQAALERGYRTGYSDGYQAGWRDRIENSARDYQSKEDYQRADRTYVPAYGVRADYRDGYQQGYELGYNTGYEQRGFDSSVPPGLARHGVQTSDASGGGNNSSSGGYSAPPYNPGRNPDPADPGSVSDSSSRRGGGVGDSGSAPADLRGTVYVPRDTNLRIQLRTRLSSDVSQSGDRFEADVLEPAQFAGAVLSGRVARVRRPGRVRGTAQLQLDFEQLRLPDGRFANLRAQVIEIVRRTGTGVDDVDPEGGVRGRDRTNDDVTKVGAGAGIGAVIGAIAGGGRGAAIGAVIGAGVGTAGVLTSSGGDIRLEQGTELVVRTSSDTRIQ